MVVCGGRLWMEVTLRLFSNSFCNTFFASLIGRFEINYFQTDQSALTSGRVPTKLSARAPACLIQFFNFVQVGSPLATFLANGCR